MASTAQNNHAAGPRLVVTSPIAGATVINQGDLCKIVANLVVAQAGVTDPIHGMIDDSNPVAGLADQLTKVAVLRPGAGVHIRLKLKNGESVNFNDLVYLDTTDPQTVSTASGGGALVVGRVRELAAVTGDGSTRILIEFTAAA